MDSFTPLGIDFGSKLAGTTAICWQEKNRLRVIQSAPKQDADEFLIRHILDLKPSAIWIDAPLSLPIVYSRPSCGDDFFYRKADRETQAMSPMFLGGLTARAMKLRHRLNEFPFYEAYPGHLARIWAWEKLGYKKPEANLKELSVEIERLTGLKISNVRTNHEMDAILTWCIAWRYQNGLALQWGNPDEGLIYT